MEETTSKTELNQILEALNDLNQNTVATNNSVKELQEYMIIQDNRKQREAAEQAKQEEEESKLEETEKASAEAEQSAKADAETETYTELLTNIDNSLQLTNQLLVVQSIYIGVVVGLLFMKILFDRIFK